MDHTQDQAGSYLKDKLGLQNCHIITFIEILVRAFCSFYWAEAVSFRIIDTNDLESIPLYKHLEYWLKIINLVVHYYLVYIVNCKIKRGGKREKRKQQKTPISVTYSDGICLYFSLLQL